jgi:RHS repeat-associated protein
MSRRLENNFRLPGQYEDPETGLYYNMNRYYWPWVGRYITPDPILQTGNAFNVNLVNDFIVPNLIGNPDQFHPYVYVTNQPINIIDPLGLKGCCRFWLDVSGQAVALKWGTGTGASYYRCTDDCPVAKRSGWIRYNCSCYGLALGGGITVSPFSCCSNSSKDLTNSGSQFTIWFINIPTPPLYAVGLSLGFTPGCNAFGTSIGIGVGIGAGKCKCTIL